MNEIWVKLPIPSVGIETDKRPIMELITPHAYPRQLAFNRWAWEREKELGHKSPAPAAMLRTVGESVFGFRLREG